MADRKIKKIIMANQPEDGMRGQYSFDDENNTLNGVGFSENGLKSLYSLMYPYEENELNRLDLPSTHWPYKGISIEVNQVYMKNRQSKDQVYGRLRSWFYDDAVDGDVSTAVDAYTLRDSFMDCGDDCDKHRFMTTAGWNDGCTDWDASSDDIRLGQFESGGWDTYLEEEWHHGYNTWSEKEMSISDFPFNPTAGGKLHSLNDMSGDFFDNDLDTYSDYINEYMNVAGGNYWILTRCEGTAEEIGSCNTDRRNKLYQKFRIPKRYLYDVITNKNISKLVIRYGAGSCGDYSCEDRYASDNEFYPGLDVGYYDLEGNIIGRNQTYRDVTGIWSKPTSYQDNYGTEDDEGGWFGDDKKSAAYEVSHLIITIHSPISDAYDPKTNYPDGFSEYQTRFGAFDIKYLPDYDKIDPMKEIDYYTLYEDDESGDAANYVSNPRTSSQYLDFRPISYISVNNQWEYDLQSFYTFEQGYEYTSAPSQVNLTFRIAENSAVQSINYYDGFIDAYDEPFNQEVNIESLGIYNYMFFVTDWDATDMEMNWENIRDEIPISYQEMLSTADEDLFTYQSLYKQIDTNDDNALDFWTTDSITHEYESPGYKIIHAVVFSYVNSIDNCDEESCIIHPIIWKGVAIKLFLGIDNAYVEDFSDLGGFGYRFIPWPETSGIIGGISDNSTYVNDTKSIVQENKFSDSESLEEGLAYRAYHNTPGGHFDELGEHPGEIDISQFRYFSTGANSDLSDLLMLPNQCHTSGVPNGIICTVVGDCDGGDTCDFVRFNQWDHWTDGVGSDMPKFPRNENGEINSCVGLLFIEDESNIPRKTSCIVEYNYSSLDNITVRDSTGHDNRGIAIGDYGVGKSEIDDPIFKKSTPLLPEQNVEDKAF